jgi:hypothetical protein
VAVFEKALGAEHPETNVARGNSKALPLWGKRSLRREAALADLDAMHGREQLRIQ